MKSNKLKTIVKILAIIVICLISFIGIYVQNLNKMENIVKDFNLSKDLKGYREAYFSIKKTEDAENADTEEIYTVENYRKAKEIIENRLKNMGVDDYNLSLNEETGMIYLQLPENTETDTVVGNVAETGTIELKDSEDGTVYLTTDNLKKASTLYGNLTTGTTVYLELEFDNEGKNKLKELSENDYKTVKQEENTEDKSEDTENQETSENAENSNLEENAQTEENENKDKEEVKQKKVALYISGNEVISTSFDEPVLEGKIDLTMGAASTDNSVIEERIKSASIMTTILNSGALPFSYESKNQYVGVDYSSQIKNVILVVCAFIGILLIYMVIKYKKRGILSAISYLGFMGLYLLLLRYTNVMISLEGIAGIVLVGIINYVFSIRFLKLENSESKIYNEEYKKMLFKLLPVFGISIVFCFIKLVPLSSLGMVAFWGIALIAIYNILVTKHIVE